MSVCWLCCTVFQTTSLLFSSLSIPLSFGLAVIPGCQFQTLRQSNARKITDNFQYCILRFRNFQPKLKMYSRRFLLSFINYTNCIKWLSGVDGFPLSSPACILSLRQGVQTGSGKHRTSPMGTVNFFLGITQRYRTVSILTIISAAKNIDTVCTRARNLSLSWATCIRFTHTLTLTYFSITRERQKARTLKWSLLLRISAKIMYAFFNSPTCTPCPSLPITLMTMHCTNYYNYHNTLCYFLLLLIPFNISTLHSAPWSQHTQRTRHSSLRKTTSGCLWCVHQINDFHEIWELRSAPVPTTHLNPSVPLKNFGGQSLWCYHPKAGSTSVPNCRESLKSSNTLNVILHIKSVHLRWTQWYWKCHPEA